MFKFHSCTSIECRCLSGLLKLTTVFLMLFQTQFLNAETVSPSTGVEAELKAYIKDKTPENAKKFITSYNKLRLKMLESFIRINPTYKKKAIRAAELESKINLYAKKLAESSPEIQKITVDLENAKKSYDRLYMDDSRRDEIDSKREQIKNLENTINDIIATNPEVEKMVAEFTTIKIELTDLVDKLVKSSATPEAADFNKISKMLAEYCNNKSEYFQCTNIPKNVFNGLFDGMEKRRWGETYGREYYYFIKNNLKKEHPEINLAVLDEMTNMIFRGLYRVNKDKVTFATGNTPIEQVYNHLLQYRIDNDKRKLVRALRKSNADFPADSFTNHFIYLIIQNNITGSMFNNRIVTLVLRMCDKGHFKGNDADFAYWTIDKNLPYDQWKDFEARVMKIKDMDPWLKNLLCGRSIIRQAWKARGGGYADTITEEGGKEFHQKSDLAIKLLKEAHKMRPDRAEPASMLIEAVRGICPTSSCVDWFIATVKIQPDYRNAYGTIAWSMLQRWGGSQEMMLALADECFGVKYYQTIIPAFGMDFVNRAAWDNDDYRWQVFYMDKDRDKNIMKLFENRINNSQGWYLDQMYVVKTMYLIASLQYDKAMDIVKRKLSFDKFTNMYDAYHWNPCVATLFNPRMPVWENYPAKLKLFTGPEGKKLREAERDFLASNKAAARIKLRSIIKNGKLTQEEKDLLIDLYARYSMNLPPRDFQKPNGAKKPRSAFQVAIKNGHRSIMEEMLTMGYDFKKYESYPGETAYQAASGAFSPNVFKALKANGDPLTIPGKRHKRPPLTVAAESRNAEAARQLIKLGVPLELKTPEGHTAVHLASARNAVEAMKVLLDAGADPDAQDNDGDTSLMFSMQVNGPEELWLQLMKKTKNINMTNKRGRAAIHYAAEYYKKANVVPKLIEYGAKVDSTDNDGVTPLMIAVEKKKYDCVENLIKAGADPAKKDHRGQDAVTRAKDDSAMLKILTKS